MNIQEANILRTILSEPFHSQRMLAEAAGYSLGAVNKSLKALIRDGYLDGQTRPTAKALRAAEACAPKNAIILAAGAGPFFAPGALFRVQGERLIERLIRQLNEAGVSDVTVAVGFQKERFEYLIDAYGVRLSVNPDYRRKNNLHTLALVRDRIRNTYVLPADLFFAVNPFRRRELYAWYLVGDGTDSRSDVRVNRKAELVKTADRTGGSTMIGVAYLTGEAADAVRETLAAFDRDPRHDGDFWESTLYRGAKLLLPARVFPVKDVLEINTYEDLTERCGEPNRLPPEARRMIADVFHIEPDAITECGVLKKGMTNRSFLFEVGGRKYILRVPGAGTDRLIDRAQEGEVYRTIRGLGLCDDPVWFDPKTGCKITEYIDGARVCDANDPDDLRRCMEKLSAFHRLRLSVPHRFDIFGQTDFYESLREGQPSVYPDYAETKANVLRLKPFIDGMPKETCLAHIDAVPDNFLFCPTDAGETLQLCDWEYAGMQDPHVDVAMFCIYSLYDKAQTDRLIDLYFDGGCGLRTRAKIYAYMAACGLLWSNWCEYKRTFGVEFGEYSLRQYRYAKEYARYAKDAAERDRASVHTVRRAVILAAGTGYRMRPVTLQTPKPLVRVNGVRMIDTIIDALHRNGITEIYIVVGYRKEQFQTLQKQYPGVTLIENPDYETADNIGSLYAARAYCRDCLILDGDQIVRNPAVLSPTFTRSGYSAVWCEGETNEWLMTVADGIVTGCSRTGGKHGWRLCSVSRWSAEDGERLAALVEREYRSGKRKLYWDDVPMFLHADAFTLGVYPIRPDDLMEIDSMEELIAQDPSYRETEGTDREP